MSQTSRKHRSVDRDSIVTIACSDIAGQVRGKGFPAAQLQRRKRFGVGWTPTNVMINVFNTIPSTPFGSRGDLMMVPADGGDIRLEFDDGSPVEHTILGNIQKTNGEPWECCLRNVLKRALDNLERKAGLRLMASFEHEFWIHDAEERPGDAYAVSTLHGIRPFIGDVLGALRANDIEPDTFLPEYGPRQFEITIDPAIGMKAADDAVKLREICKTVGRRHGHKVTFSPVVSRGIIGNGVHIHFSLIDLEGKPASFDGSATGKLSVVQGAFAAGIIRHAKAVCALTTPSVLSYERLKPHSWCSYYANLADRDRESLLRICPYPEVDGLDIAGRFNIEYRAADATASPYLQLAALVFAGLEGVQNNLPMPHLSTGDPGELSQSERDRHGIGNLPRSLKEALDALEADEAAARWLGPQLTEAYLMHKRGEIQTAEDKNIDELVQIYVQAY